MCMHSKPSEITKNWSAQSPGCREFFRQGYEISWEGQGSIMEAIDWWLSSAGHCEWLLSIGCSGRNGKFHCWFAKEVDPNGPPPAVERIIML